MASEKLAYSVAKKVLTGAGAGAALGAGAGALKKPDKDRSRLKNILTGAGLGTGVGAVGGGLAHQLRRVRRAPSNLPSKIETKPLRSVPVKSDPREKALDKAQEILRKSRERRTGKKVPNTKGTFTDMVQGSDGVWRVKESMLRASILEKIML